jgi:hypothetical protein
MAHKEVPASVDFITFPFEPDSTYGMDTPLVDMVIVPFLLDPAYKVRPAPKNVIIAALLRDVTHKFRGPVVDLTVCSFSHSNLSSYLVEGATAGGN